MIAEGLDPGAEKKRTRENQLREREQTFEWLACNYPEKQAREGRAPSTLKKNRWVVRQGNFWASVSRQLVFRCAGLQHHRDFFCAINDEDYCELSIP